jgi:hypothetical protein
MELRRSHGMSDTGTTRSPLFKTSLLHRKELTTLLTGFDGPEILSVDILTSSVDILTSILFPKNLTISTVVLAISTQSERE